MVFFFETQGNRIIQSTSPINCFHLSPISLIQSTKTDQKAFSPFYSKNKPENADEFAITPAIVHKDNSFLHYATQTEEKSIKEIRKDLDDQVENFHNRLAREYGFVGRNHSSEIRKIYEVFEEKLIPAYNILALERGYPPYNGKLFIVNSGEINAWVFAEHEDVYITFGLIRELAHYCLLLNIPFTEELIATVFAHELSHVLQHNSYG